MIASLLPGDLAAFQKLDEERWREVAIHTIGKNCLASGKTAVSGTDVHLVGARSPLILLERTVWPVEKQPS